jgi:UDP-N-acetylmuramate--alanine ligase
MDETVGIAVTGTHGKTTTTTLLGSVLIECGMDPTVVVGAEVEAFGGSLRIGEGRWFVAEACEAYAAIRDMHPQVALLLNLESDHLHYHGSFDNLIACVREFVASLPPDGLLITLADDEVCGSIAASARCRVLTFGIGFGDYRASALEPSADGTTFDLWRSSDLLGSLTIAMPGEHNVRNALAAAVAAIECGCHFDAVARAMARPIAAERRLEEKATVRGVTLVDDYAHHPTEIRASIAALRQRYPARRLVVAFQPHLYTRTRDYLLGFAEALVEADALVLTDIYPAREAPIPGVGSARIAEEVTRIRPDMPFAYVPLLHDVPKAVLPSLRDGDVFVAMGAGDINEILGPIGERIVATSGTTLKVLVVAGGHSAEREVSRATGEMVAGALREKGFDVDVFDPTGLRDEFESLISGRSVTVPARRAAGPMPNVVFVAMHGSGGEDGSLQGLLELAGLPYTGSGVLASALAMNKHLAKRVLGAAGIPVASGRLVTRQDPLPEDLPLPAVVKPNSQGSSVGLGFATTLEELCIAVKIALRYDTEALIEPFLRGTELSACVLGNQNPEVLPLVEIVPAKGTYDYESKYTPGLTEEIVPARVPDGVAAEAARIATECHRVLGCAGFSRVDMMLTEEGLKVLEVNTVPGMTPTSIFPRAAAAAGISFPDLCGRLVGLALEAADARRPVL